jgi:hypothetical protein
VGSRPLILAGSLRSLKSGPHENRRYVKLALIGLVGALALPAPGQAEIVAPTTSDGLLAVAPDGSPRVAYLSGRDLVLAKRTASGWTSTGLGRAPAGGGLFGLVVDGAGRPSVLAEADNGSWIALASRGRPVRVVARPVKGSSFGPAGLTLDTAGRPAFAYAVRRNSAKTYLRLVTTDRRGRLRTHPITRRGFPSSPLVPGAAPVLVRRTLHVVETFADQAIDWGPKPKGGWEGQFLYASRAGELQGKVGAAASGGSLWSSWTEIAADGPTVLLTLSAGTQTTWEIAENAIFVSLSLTSGRPEVGAYTWVEPTESSFAYAGLVADTTGIFAEFDGRVEGYAVAANGTRQLLLSTASGLEWFEATGRPSTQVSFTPDATGHITGHVTGATAGVVQIYRELGSAGRTLVATAEIAPDGSFSAQDSAPTSPTFYRAVYIDPATNIPYASLLRTPVGPG